MGTADSPRRSSCHSLPRPQPPPPLTISPGDATINGLCVLGRGLASVTIPYADTANVSIRVLDWQLWIGSPLPPGGVPAGPIIAGITRPPSVRINGTPASPLPASGSVGVTAVVPNVTAPVLTYSWG